MDLLINAMIGYDALSFMDEYSEYNQIEMHSEDEEMITFRPLNGVMKWWHIQITNEVSLPSNIIRPKECWGYIPTRHGRNLQKNAWRYDGMLCWGFGHQVTPKDWSSETLTVMLNKLSKHQMKINKL